MTNPKIVEGDEVKFEETGKKPDSLEQVIVQPSAAGSSSLSANQEGSNKVAQAFRELLQHYRNYGSSTGNPPQNLDLLIPHVIELSYYKDSSDHKWHSKIGLLAIPSDLLKQQLSFLYGDFVLETDLLDAYQDNQPVKIEEIKTIFPELSLLKDCCGSYCCDENIIKNPYLLVLQAEPEHRNFLTGAIQTAEKNNDFKELGKYDDKMDICRIKNYLSLKSILQYAKEVGKKDLKAFQTHLTSLFER